MEPTPRQEQAQAVLGWRVKRWAILFAGICVSGPALIQAGYPWLSISAFFVAVIVGLRLSLLVVGVFLHAWFVAAGTDTSEMDDVVLKKADARAKKQGR